MSGDVRARSGSWWERLRDRYEWLGHLARAGTHYVEFNGYQYAASIAYFSALSLVPLLMVLLSTVSFVLAAHPMLVDQLHHAINQSVPATLQGTVNGLADNVVDHRFKIGLFGLLVGLYSGWNWMNTLRDALTAMWQQRRPAEPLIRTVLTDLLALASLGVALLVSFSLTVVGGSLGGLVLNAVGMGGSGAARVLLTVLSLVLSLVANWLVLLWVLVKLPRHRGPLRWRTATKAALAGSVGFELLKQAGNVYVRALGRSPTGIALGTVVGLLVFMYLVSRMLMLLTAWLATARNPRWLDVPAARVTVIRPAPHRGASGAAGVFGLGVMSALFARWLLTRLPK